MCTIGVKLALKVVESSSAEEDSCSIMLSRSFDNPSIVIVSSVVNILNILPPTMTSYLLNMPRPALRTAPSSGKSLAEKLVPGGEGCRGDDGAANSAPRPYPPTRWASLDRDVTDRISSRSESGEWRSCLTRG